MATPITGHPCLAERIGSALGPQPSAEHQALTDEAALLEEIEDVAHQLNNAFMMRDANPKRRSAHEHADALLKLSARLDVLLDRYHRAGTPEEWAHAGTPLA